MQLQDWWNLFWQQIKETDALQWLAVLLGVAEVLLAKANKIALYPVGIAGTLMSIYILLLAGLYAECLLNGYYVVMSIYGWWYWIKKSNKPPVTVSYCNRKDWITVVLIVAISFILLAFSLKYFTSSTVPVWDAWVSATAWAGMWLLSPSVKSKTGYYLIYPTCLPFRCWYISSCHFLRRSPYFYL
jgi:nicotinamide mononucleotide transporter